MIKYAIHQYLPKRYLKRASFEDIDRHRQILDFKDGKSYATAWAAREISHALSGMDLTDTIIVCIPASCKRTNDRRFKCFSSLICERTGAVNGFDHVQVMGHRRKAHTDHARVFPEPAPAMISEGPSVHRTAAFCALFNPSNRSVCELFIMVQRYSKILLFLVTFYRYLCQINVKYLLLTK